MTTRGKAMELLKAFEKGELRHSHFLEHSNTIRPTVAQNIGNLKDKPSEVVYRNLNL